MSNLNARIIALNILCLLVSYLSNAQFSMDSTYGSNACRIDISLFGGKQIHKIIPLSNDQQLAVGTSNLKVRVWKINSNGSTDNSFGTSGVASISALDNVVGNVRRIIDLKQTSNGTIYVLFHHEVTHATTYDSTDNLIGVASFNSNGSVNTMFGNGGFVIDRPHPDFSFRPTALDVHEVGSKVSIWVAAEAIERGHASCPLGYGKWCVVKYMSSGSKDVSFNSTGYKLGDASDLKLTPASFPFASIKAIKVLSNSNIKIVGALILQDSAVFNAQLTQSGQWDNTFGTNGRTNTKINYLHAVTYETGRAKILQNNSVLFWTASYYNASTDTMFINILKHTPQGTVDLTYGNAGFSGIGIASSNSIDAAIKQSGEILFSGYHKYSGIQFVDFALVNSDGSIPINFGIQGHLRTEPIPFDPTTNMTYVMQLAWNYNETKVYVAAHRFEMNGLGSLIIRYKWPGLTPLSTVSIDESQARIYPNPCTNYFYIDIDKPSTIMVYNSFGLLLYNQQLAEGSHNVDMSANSSGTYIIQINENGKQKTHRVIKL